MGCTRINDPPSSQCLLFIDDKLCSHLVKLAVWSLFLYVVSVSKEIPVMNRLAKNIELVSRVLFEINILFTLSR